MAVILAVVGMSGCGGQQAPLGSDGVPEVPDAPAEFKKGAEVYAEACAICHGQEGVGTSKGPPLVHDTYEPSHHGDNAFYNAAEQGVSAHHFDFGPMPPQPSVARDEMTEIIGYVRWLQREAGIDSETATTLVAP